MDTKQALARSLKELRVQKGITQEDFSEVSSRTYVSMIERGVKRPTLEKIEAFAQVLGVHPLTLLCLTYVNAESDGDLDELFARVRRELEFKVDVQSP